MSMVVEHQMPCKLYCTACPLAHITMIVESFRENTCYVLRDTKKPNLQVQLSQSIQSFVFLVCLVLNAMQAWRHVC